MKKILLVLSAILFVIAVQSCDNFVNEEMDAAGAQSRGNTVEGLPESDLTMSTTYRLIEGSVLYASISPMGPVFAVPINGSFSLCADYSLNNLCALFKVSGLEFESKDHNPRFTGKDGNGTYELCNSVSVIPRQRMKLTVSIGGSRLIPMDSGYVAAPADVKFPWIDITLKTTWNLDSIDGILPSYQLHIVAVPMKDIAFTTVYSFTSGITGIRVNHGDLLSARGRIILTNAELIKEFNLWPTLVIQEPGLDAVNIPILSTLPVARPFVFFSTNKDIMADGKPGQGDILDNSGRIVMRNRELTAPFGPMPITPDVGLDALQVFSYGPAVDKPVFLFSTERGFFSETLGVYIGPGDLLLSVGKVYMTEVELLRNFSPIHMGIAGVGVDAVALRRNKEIWFSVTRDFQDARLGRIGNGDLLSDTGRIVCRNRDLVAGFNIPDDLADVGLDGLSIIE
ncbi:MAG: hypothetical protein JW969_12225 [Spirochaetales bacterium]|nr:hypothetical protein [Spirochaetales bacterium]